MLMLIWPSARIKAVEVGPDVAFEDAYMRSKRGSMTALTSTTKRCGELDNEAHRPH